MTPYVPTAASASATKAKTANSTVLNRERAIDFANRLLRVERMNYIPRGAGDVLGRAASANDKSHRRIGQFRMRPIGHRLRLTIERHVLAIGHDADNFARHVLVFHVNRHPFADWVFAGQILTRESFVDDYHVALIGSLLRSEETTLHKRNLHCSEIVRIGYAHSGR